MVSFEYYCEAEQHDTIVDWITLNEMEARVYFRDEVCREGYYSTDDLCRPALFTESALFRLTFDDERDAVAFKLRWAQDIEFCH